MFVLVCQLVEVIQEADVNEISGELTLASFSSVIGESQFFSLKYVTDYLTFYSNNIT